MPPARPTTAAGPRSASSNAAGSRGPSCCHRPTTTTAVDVPDVRLDAGRPRGLLRAPVEHRPELPIPSATYKCYTNHTTFTPYSRLCERPASRAAARYPPSIGATYYWQRPRDRSAGPQSGCRRARRARALVQHEQPGRLVVRLRPRQSGSPRSGLTGRTIQVPTLSWVDASGASKYQVTILDRIRRPRDERRPPMPPAGRHPRSSIRPMAPSTGTCSPTTSRNRLSVIPAQPTWWSFSLEPITPTAITPDQTGPAHLSSSVMMPSLSLGPGHRRGSLPGLVELQRHRLLQAWRRPALPGPDLRGLHQLRGWASTRGTSRPSTRRAASSRRRRRCARS